MNSNTLGSVASTSQMWQQRCRKQMSISSRSNLNLWCRRTHRRQQMQSSSSIYINTTKIIHSFTTVAFVALVTTISSPPTVSSFQIPVTSIYHTVQTSHGIKDNNNHYSFNSKRCQKTYIGPLRQSFGTFQDSSDSSYARSLLDGDQLQGIVNRALEEEELLQNDFQGILQMPTVQERKDAIKIVKRKIRAEKNTSAGDSVGGFGGGGGIASKSKKAKGVSKKKKNSTMKKNDGSYKPELDKDGHGAVLLTQGVVRMNQVLSLETVQSLKTYTNNYLEHAIEMEPIRSANGQPSRFSASVLLPKNRWDLLLSLEDEEDASDDKLDHDVVMQALDELIGEENGTLNSLIHSVVGKDAILYEFATLISDPGSQRQVTHPDIEFGSENAVTLLTCFVALQDITQEMGPTFFLPQTNTQYHHDQLKQKSNEMLSSIPNVLSTLQAGDCSAYNPETLHGGSSNRSESQRRSIFYMTFRNPLKDNPSIVNNPGSLRTDYQERQYSLDDVRAILKEWKSKSP